MENFWQSCSSQLELELTPQQYTAWIKPLVALDYEDGKLRIAAPNRFKLDWVRSQFANRITALASDFWERPVEVQFVLDPRTLPKKPAPATSTSSQGNGAGMNGGALVWCFLKPKIVGEGFVIFGRITKGMSLSGGPACIDIEQLSSGVSDLLGRLALGFFPLS